MKKKVNEGKASWKRHVLVDLSSEIQNKSEESVAFTGYGNEEDCLELIFILDGWKGRAKTSTGYNLEQESCAQRFVFGKSQKHYITTFVQDLMTLNSVAKMIRSIYQEHYINTNSISNSTQCELIQELKYS